MKIVKPLLLLLFLFVVSKAHAQDIETQEMIRSIQGYWKLNNAGQVVCTKVIAFPGSTKEDIYYSALYYLHQDYGNAGIQLQDLEKGTILVKGVYPRVHIAGGRSNQYHFNTIHEVQIEVKDEVMTLKVMLNGYFLTSASNPYYAQAAEVYSTDADSSPNNFAMADLYPTGKHTSLYSIDKEDSGRAFYESHQQAWETIYRLSGVFTAATGEEVE